MDNFMGIELPHIVYTAFTFLKGLLQDLGFQISRPKLVAPSSKVVCIGITFDVTTHSLSIPQSKLNEIYKACIEWQAKSTITKTQLQSLLGNLP